MTVCLVDQNDRLKQLSRLFFRELAQKGNALYNVMPDIISRLSDPEVGVDEVKFRLTVELVNLYITVKFRSHVNCPNLIFPF